MKHFQTNNTCFIAGEELSRLLRLEAALYQHTRDAYWHITGFDLQEVPEFYNQQFLELAGIIDGMVELLLALGYPEGYLNGIIRDSASGDSISVEGSNAYFRKLIALHEQALAQLTAIFRMVTESLGPCINFISGTIDRHKNLLPMLRSGLKNSVFAVKVENCHLAESNPMLFV